MTQYAPVSQLEQQSHADVFDEAAFERAFDEAAAEHVMLDTSQAEQVMEHSNESTAEDFGMYDIPSMQEDLEHFPPPEGVNTHPQRKFASLNMLHSILII